MSESPSHEGSLASAQLTEPVRRAAQALFTTLQGSIAPEYWLEVVDALQGLVFVASRDVARQAVYEGVLTTTADALLSRQNLMDLLVDRLRASDA